MGFQPSDTRDDRQERDRHGAGRGEAHLQPRVHQPHRRDHRLRRAQPTTTCGASCACSSPAQREPQGPKLSISLTTARCVRLAPRGDAQGPLVRRAAAAPRHPAPHRGPAVGGVHPRPASGRSSPSRSVCRTGGSLATGRTAAAAACPSVAPHEEPGTEAATTESPRHRGTATLLLLGVSVSAVASLPLPRLPRMPRSWRRPRRPSSTVGRAGEPVPAEGDAPLLHLDQARRPLRRVAAARGLPPPLGHGLRRRPAASTCATPPDGRQGRDLPVNERKRIQIVDYRGSKALSTTDHRRRAEEEGGAASSIDTFYDLGKARRVEPILKEMLAEKGHPFAKVKHDAKSVGGAGYAGLVRHRRGPEGQGQGDRLRRQRGLLRRRPARRHEEDEGGASATFWHRHWPALGKNTYTTEKWSGPRGRPEAAARTSTSTTGTSPPPSASRRSPTSTGKSGSKKKPRKWARLEIPVSEGDQYRIGEVKFEGMTVFKAELVRPLFKLQTGDVYRGIEDREGLRQAARRLRRAGLLPVDGAAGAASPTPSARSWTSP